MLEVTVKAHVCWDQMWTHIHVGRSMVAENAHGVLTVDTHLCLRLKVAEGQFSVAGESIFTSTG